MSMVEDIGGEEGLHKFSDLFYGYVAGDAALTATFEGVDTPEQRATLENGVRLFLEFETDQAVPVIGKAHQPLVGRGLTDEGFDALYGYYEDSLSEVGLPAGMIHSFLDLFEDLRETLVK